MYVCMDMYTYILHVHPYMHVYINVITYRHTETERLMDRQTEFDFDLYPAYIFLYKNTFVHPFIYLFICLHIYSLGLVGKINLQSCRQRTVNHFAKVSPPLFPRRAAHYEYQEKEELDIIGQI